MPRQQIRGPAVAMAQVEDGAALCCTAAFCERMGFSGDGLEDLTALLASTPALATARAGGTWRGVVVAPSGEAIPLVAERAGAQLVIGLDEAVVSVASTEEDPAAQVACARSRAHAFGRLAEGAVHDVRNPLNALAIHLELAQTRLAELPPDAGERLGRHLQAARDQVARVDGVLRRFLRFASPSSRTGEIELAELVEQAVQACTHVARRSGVRLDTQLSRARVSGDEAQVGTAVLQLVLEGIDASVAGSLTIAVDRGESEAVLRLSEEPAAAAGPGEAGACPKPVEDPSAREAPLRGAGQMVEFLRGVLTARTVGRRTEIELRLPLSPAETRAAAAQSLLPR